MLYELLSQYMIKEIKYLQHWVPFVVLYYWFDKSFKHERALLRYYIFCAQEYEQIICYASTR